MPEIESDVCLRIRVLNQQRQPLGGTVDIQFAPQTVGQALNVKAADASKDIDISGLQRTPQGLYQVTVTPTSVFRPSSQFVNIPASGFNTVEFVIASAGGTQKGPPPPAPAPTPTPPPPPPEGDDIGMRIRVLNAQKQPLGGTVDIDIQSQNTSDSYSLKGVDASKDIDVTGLARFPQVSVYEVTVTPTQVFKPTSQFVSVPASGFNTVVFVIDVGSQPLPTIPDQLNAKDLGTALGLRLGGRPADGSRPPDPTTAGPSQVVWVDNGDEVLVHLDSTRVQILPKTVLVSVDLETDQTGRQPLIVALALGDGSDDAGLVATTDEIPRGNGLLAARWGEALQASVWATLMQMSQEHAFERSKAPRGVTVVNGLLNFRADTPLQAVAPSAVRS
jgi:hypothetical protein